MTSSRKPTTLKFLRSWFVNHPSTAASILLFLVLWVHGASLGLSDDEAYYWVLAQKPALGYAFHPPAVAWLIALFQGLFKPVSAGHSSALVRLPAALGSGLILWIALTWLKTLKLDAEKLWRAVPVILSFFGFFSLSWMMVPDIPLFLGLTLVFGLTWKVVFGKARSFDFILIAFGVFLAVLGKYSGVLVALSSAMASILWAPPQVRKRSLWAVALGLGAAAFPILLWNAQHEWASILYQIRDRHGGELSLLRYLKFWLTQLALVGPLTIFGFFYFIFKVGLKRQSSEASESVSQMMAYVLVWSLPPASVYFTQPLFGDFKPHWAFVAWWPIVLALSYFFAARRRGWGWIRFQAAYGLFMGGVILLACHVPFFTWLGVNPRNDVTNDLYGWPIAEQEAEKMALNLEGFPIVGSRYQTAAQAAFQFKNNPVTFIPRSKKEWEEWPDLGISDEPGPDWPVLRKPVFYVADNRYDAAPAFSKARCLKLFRAAKLRFNTSVGWIELWRCDPM